MVGTDSGSGHWRREYEGSVVPDGRWDSAVQFPPPLGHDGQPPGRLLRMHYARIPQLTNREALYGLVLPLVDCIHQQDAWEDLHYSQGIS